jgi:hypothetical protein
MTTVITRLYADRQTAEGVAHRLTGAGLSAETIDIFDNRTGGVRELRVAKLGPANARAHHQALAQGGALLVVRAPFNPIGAARAIKDMVAEVPSIAVPGGIPNEYVREQAGHAYLHILKDHPKFFSQDLEFLDSRARGLVSHAFGFRTLSPLRERTSAVGRSRPILGAKPRSGGVKTSAIRGGWRFSDMIGWRTISRSS